MLIILLSDLLYIVDQRKLVIFSSDCLNRSSPTRRGAEYYGGHFRVGDAGHAFSEVRPRCLFGIEKRRFLEYARGSGSQIDGSFARRVMGLPRSSSGLVRTSRLSIQSNIFRPGGKRERESRRKDGERSNVDGRETSRTLDLVLVNCSPFISATFCFSSSSSSFYSFSCCRPLLSPPPYSLL